MKKLWILGSLVLLTVSNFALAGNTATTPTPTLPENNIPSNQRQSSPISSQPQDVPNNTTTPVTGNTSNGPGTEVNAGTNTTVTPRAGTRNGTLTGNGAGVGADTGLNR